MTSRSQNLRLTKSKKFSSNIFLHDWFVHSWKVFSWLSLSKATRDSPRFRFWLRCAIWLRSVMHTAELDSAVWCTSQRLNPRYDAHCKFFWEIWVTWLCGVMHTAELDSSEGSSPWSFLKIRISCRNRYRIRRYFTLFIRGPDGFESWKK